VSKTGYLQQMWIGKS